MTSDTAAPAVEISRLSVTDLALHGAVLLRAYAEEMEPGLAEILDPDWDTYEELEAQGRLLVLGAWITEPCLDLGEGLIAPIPADALVGFAVAVIMPRLEVRGSCIAYHQALYVTPCSRNRVGLRLITRMLAWAREQGATEFMMKAPAGSKFEELLPRLGFSRYAVDFRKEL